MTSAKNIMLKRSKMTVAFDEDFPASDVIAAQKAAGKDSNMFPLYLAQRVCTFDGAKLTLGDLKEKVRGKDYLQLVGALLADADDAEAEGNDRSGN